MSSIEKVKKHLVELAKVVNAFRSEAVQVRVIDWLLRVIDSDTTDNARDDFSGENGSFIRAHDNNRGGKI